MKISKFQKKQTKDARKQMGDVDLYSAISVLIEDSDLEEVIMITSMIAEDRDELKKFKKFSKKYSKS